MTLSGSCEECAAPILGDQDHCVICGLRVVAPVTAPKAIASRRGSRRGIPVRPQAALFAGALTFGFGSLIGAGVGPSADRVLAAATPIASQVGTQLADAGSGGGPDRSDNAGSRPDQSSSPDPAPAPVTPITPVTPVPTSPVPEDPPPEDPPADVPDDPTEPPADDTTIAQGVVVRVNPSAGSYSIASGGLLSTVHAKELPDAGSEVKVNVDPLSNGTLEESGERTGTKPADEATFSGTVTWVAPEGDLYVLSSSGASVPIAVPAASGGQEPEVPALASSVTAEVDIENALEPQRHARQAAPDVGTAPTPADPAAPTAPSAATAPICLPDAPLPEEPIDPEIVLTQKSFIVEFENLAVAAAEGVVQAVCADEHQVVISADDLRQTGMDLTLRVPAKVDTSALEPGDSVLVNLNPTPGDDGTLELTGFAGDTGLKDADNEELGQGDLAG